VAPVKKIVLEVGPDLLEFLVPLPPVFFFFSGHANFFPPRSTSSFRGGRSRVYVVSGIFSLSFAPEGSGLSSLIRFFLKTPHHLRQIAIGGGHGPLRPAT